MHAEKSPFPNAHEVEVTGRVPAASGDVFEKWTRLDDLPDYLPEVENVEKIDDKLSNWVINDLEGRPQDSVAEITELEPPHVVAWRSTTGPSWALRVEVVGNDGVPAGTEGSDLTLIRWLPTAEPEFLAQTEKSLFEALQRFTRSLRERPAEIMPGAAIHGEIKEARGTAPTHWGTAAPSRSSGNDSPNNGSHLEPHHLPPEF